MFNKKCFESCHFLEKKYLGVNMRTKYILGHSKIIYILAQMISLFFARKISLFPLKNRINVTEKN